MIYYPKTLSHVAIWPIETQYLTLNINQGCRYQHNTILI